MEEWQEKLDAVAIRSVAAIALVGNIVLSLFILSMPLLMAALVCFLLSR